MNEQELHCFKVQGSVWGVCNWVRSSSIEGQRGQSGWVVGWQIASNKLQPGEEMETKQGYVSYGSDEMRAVQNAEERERLFGEGLGAIVLREKMNGAN